MNPILLLRSALAILLLAFTLSGCQQESAASTAAASSEQAEAVAPAAQAPTPTEPVAGAADEFEARIRKNLGERVPGLDQLDEVTATPMPGLYEIRIGHDLLYTDAEGRFLIQGALMDTAERINLTEERMNKLNAIDFATLPLDQAFTIVRGNGERQLAVFEDPNCGYCKRFEKDMQNVDDVTVHLFLIPILGQDSLTKSSQIWCSEDRTQAWLDWMLQDKLPVPEEQCDTQALDANLAFARQHRITGTPTLVFANGHRVPGAIGAQQVEQLLTE